MNDFRFAPAFQLVGPYYSALTGTFSMLDGTSNRIYNKQILFFGEVHGECFCEKEEETPDIRYTKQDKKIVVFNEADEASIICTPALMFHIISSRATQVFDVFLEQRFKEIKELQLSDYLANSDSPDLSSLERLYKKCIRGNPQDCDYQNVRVHAIDYRDTTDSTYLKYDSRGYTVRESVVVQQGKYTYDNIFRLFVDLMAIKSPIFEETEQIIDTIIDTFYGAIDVGKALDTYLFAEHESIIDLCRTFLTRENYLIVQQLGDRKFRDYRNLKAKEAGDWVNIYAFATDFLVNMENIVKLHTNTAYYSKAAKQYLKLKNSPRGINMLHVKLKKRRYILTDQIIRDWYEIQKEDFILKFKAWKNVLENANYVDKQPFSDVFVFNLIMDVPTLCRMFYSDSEKTIYYTGSGHTKNYISFFDFVRVKYCVTQIADSSGLEVGAETVQFLNSIISGDAEYTPTSKRCKTCDTYIGSALAYKCGASLLCEYMYCSDACGRQDWTAKHFKHHQ